MSPHLLYTVGHSNQTVDAFLQLIKQFEINCIVDVRSVPASKYSPQFNEEPLSAFLKRHDVYYLPFGHYFGARRYDCLNEYGQVDFEQAVHTPAFLQGAERLLGGLRKGFHISLMCSEADPLECHRFSLVSRYFHENGLTVKHILKDAETASHAELETQMIRDYVKRKKLPETDTLFGLYDAEQQRKDAYRLKNKEIGFVQQEELAL